MIEGCAYVLLAVLVGGLLGLEIEPISWGLIALPALLIATVLALHSLRRAKRAARRKEPAYFRAQVERRSGIVAIWAAVALPMQWINTGVLGPDGFRWRLLAATVPSVTVAVIATIVFLRRDRRRLLARLRAEDAAAADGRAD